jgi:hypothetical protein
LRRSSRATSSRLGSAASNARRRRARSMKITCGSQGARSPCSAQQCYPQWSGGR